MRLSQEKSVRRLRQPACGAMMKRRRVGAWWIKSRTHVGDAWICREMQMGNRVNVSRAVKRYRLLHDAESRKCGKMFICTDSLFSLPVLFERGLDSVLTVGHIVLMKSTVKNDPVLRFFKDAVIARLGPHLRQILLFGSRARGDATVDSDYDLLVVVDKVDAAVTQGLDAPLPGKRYWSTGLRSPRFLSRRRIGLVGSTVRYCLM